MYDTPKYLLEIRIPLRLDPDRFKQIGILERTNGSSHYELLVSPSKLWQHPTDLRTLILHPWMRYFIWTEALPKFEKSTFF
jgi:hypothetical protein